MRRCQFEGLELEGRWKFKNKVSNSCYLFENIFNQNTVELSYRQVKMVLNGHDTIGHIITRRLPNTELFKYGNNQQKNWKRYKYKYFKKV